MMDNDSTVTNDINVVIKIKHDGEVLYSCVVDYEAVYDNRRCYIIRSDIQPVDLVAVMIEHGIQRVHFDSLQGIAMHNDNEGSADHSMLIVSNRNETCNRNNCQDASFSTSYRRIRSILTSMLCISSGSIDSIASQPFILPLWSSQSHTFGQFFPSSRLCSEGYLKFLNTFSHLFDEDIKTQLESTAFVNAVVRSIGRAISLSISIGNTTTLGSVVSSVAVSMEASINLDMLYPQHTDVLSSIESSLAEFKYHNRSVMKSSRSNDASAYISISNPKRALAPNTIESIQFTRVVQDSRKMHFGISTQITNTNDSNYTAVSVIEVLPFYYDIMLHTLQLTWDSGTPVFPSEAELWNSLEMRQRSENCVGFPRCNGYIQLPLISIPPWATLHVTVTAKKRLLHREDYPTDASRGFEIPPALIQIHSIGNASYSNEKPHLISTQSCLVTFPFPDFTMPFNVITLAGTVMTFLLGSMLNMIVKAANGPKKSK